jgi:hypothetical protein
MESYTKLFSSIVTSTIWTEDAETCKVWVTMLAIANQHGEVMATIPGLAQIAGLSRESVERAIHKFLSPDPYSRTPDDEGRRIEVIDGGWALLNHSKYRAMASKEEQKTANAARQKRWRDKQSRNATVTDSNAAVTPSNATVTENRDIAEAEAEADTEENPPLPPKGGPDGEQKHILPEGWKKLNTTQRNQVRVNINSKTMTRIGAFFGRRPSTLWTVAEALALKDANPSPDEIELVESYYLAEIDKENDYRRRDLQTVLNNWTKECDRARVYQASLKSR